MSIKMMSYFTLRHIVGWLGPIICVICPVVLDKVPLPKASLLGEPSGKAPAPDDILPELGEVLQDREVPAEGPSRLL